MQRVFSRLVAAIAAVCAATIVVGIAPASAHEHRHIQGDKYELVAGWGDEPTYTGYKNSVTLRITDHSIDKPVADLKDLQVQVKTGAETVDLTLSQAFGEPGLYEATLVPTRAGTYSFKFTGAINGAAFDETFTSGDDTFDAPKDPTEVQFPAKDPTPGQLAERLDRESTRVQTLQPIAADAEDKASTANTLAIAALVVGASALTVGVVAVTRRKK
jgi:hypothetical protein